LIFKKISLLKYFYFNIFFVFNNFISVLQKKNFFFSISSIHSFWEIRLYRTKFWIYFESQKVVSQKLLFYFRKKDIWELQTYKRVNSIPALHKQYDIKFIVIVEDFPKLIAQTLNSFFSKLVNNEIRLQKTQPTIFCLFKTYNWLDGKLHNLMSSLN